MPTDAELAAIRHGHRQSSEPARCACGRYHCDARKLLDEVDRLRALLDPAAWREDRDTAFIHGLEAVGASDESIAVAQRLEASLAKPSRHRFRLDRYPIVEADG